MADDDKKADFDWLYRREDAVEPTAVMPDVPPTQYPTPGAYPQAQAAYPTPAPQQPWPASPPPSVPQQTPRRSGQPGGPSTPAAKPRKKRRVWRWIALVVALWLAFMIGTPLFALSQVDVVTLDGISDRPAEQPGTAVLLVGSDSRDDLTAEERSELGTGSVGGQRTDTIMLLYTPPSGEPALISLPRDSFVNIPGHGEQKLNAAFAYGGPSLLVETVEQATGVQIDGYLEIGFKGIVDMVDAVGGVEICLDDPIKDKDSHLDLPAGCQTLDGVDALGYVRMRKADPKGDLGRVERQRKMISLIVKKAMSPGTLLNPVAYWNLNMAASSSLTKSDDTSVFDMGSAAMSFLAISGDGGYQLTVPIADANATTSAGSSVIWDTAGAEVMFKLIASGTTAGLDQFK